MAEVNRYSRRELWKTFSNVWVMAIDKARRFEKLSDGESLSLALAAGIAAIAFNRRRNIRVDFANTANRDRHQRAGRTMARGSGEGSRENLLSRSASVALIES
jgi:hypothetical protein